MSKLDLSDNENYLHRLRVDTSGDRPIWLQEVNLNQNQSSNLFIKSIHFYPYIEDGRHQTINIVLDIEMIYVCIKSTLWRWPTQSKSKSRKLLSEP